MLKFSLFTDAIRDVLEKNGLRADNFRFSESAENAALKKDWNLGSWEFQDFLRHALKGTLTELHAFIETPYVRTLDLPGGRQLHIGIFNQQSKTWYGDTQGLWQFDFIREDELGLFADCSTFLDLGGHQLIWSIYYAQTSPTARVYAFEPSPLNCLIGLFNCLVNGVLDRVQLVPFAVAADGAAEHEKMLVDFMNIPIRMTSLSKHISGTVDFAKVDIEGYEYELLGDRFFCQLLSQARAAHFELHSGHLTRRGISTSDCVAALKTAGCRGVELHTGVDMYRFLETCDPKGFYALLLSCSQ